MNKERKRKLKRNIKDWLNEAKVNKEGDKH
jgi:hypothetical protein